MPKLLIATTNKKKLAEIKAIFSDLNLEYLTLKDFPKLGDVEENGATFQENALIKARTYSRATGFLTLAEDSGICVKALDGRPGVYSARFAGPEQDDNKNLDKILNDMKSVPEGKRQAWYQSAVALVAPDGREDVLEGRVEGELLFERKGTGGFGYDPIFYYPPFKATFAEVSAEDKNRVSHRFKALQAARKRLKDLLETLPTD